MLHRPLKFKKLKTKMITFPPFACVWEWHLQPCECVSQRHALHAWILLLSDQFKSSAVHFLISSPPFPSALPPHGPNHHPPGWPLQSRLKAIPHFEGKRFSYHIIQNNAYIPFLPCSALTFQPLWSFCFSNIPYLLEPISSRGLPSSPLHTHWTK